MFDKQGRPKDAKDTGQFSPRSDVPKNVRQALAHRIEVYFRALFGRESAK
jgi:hypothetical protein